MDLFDLYAKIAIDPSEFNAGIEGASGKASSFADKLKTGLATAAKVGAAANRWYVRKRVYGDRHQLLRIPVAKP